MSDDFKPEGIRNLLLGPMTLLGELMGALVPGVLFLLLLIAKRVPAAASAVAWDGFGYKTKVACGLLIAFVVGKVFYIPLMSLPNLFVRRTAKFKLVDPKKNGTLWEQLTPEARHLFGGIFAVEFLKGATAWEHLNVAYAETTFRLSTGAVLVVASAIPGDGRLRWVELLIGTLFIVYGVLGARSIGLLGLSFMGRTGFDWYMKANEEQRKLILPILTAIFLNKSPSAAASPSPSVAQAKAAAASAGSPSETLNETKANLPAHAPPVSPP